MTCVANLLLCEIRFFGIKVHLLKLIQRYKMNLVIYCLFLLLIIIILRIIIITSILIFNLLKCIPRYFTSQIVIFQKKIP